MNKTQNEKLNPKDLWHPIEQKWIRKDGILTEFGKTYYASIARNIADKRAARKHGATNV